MSTITTDLYMIWCCWMVWGQHWLVVLLPILSLTAASGKCTLLIIYHILTIAGVKHGAAAIARGVAPTLLIGWAAAGHTRLNDDNSENTMSSLHFQTAGSEFGSTSFQESTIESAVSEIDIEAQQEQSDELVEVVERME
ncbi:hypothetical protein ARMGADRAFT_1029264 [Armillaria gallica]|uniref:Uncharacterized protein n=1 Tax=Armillaria gallica TaxID=47427 RepID=A0A2H3DI72_ARMGA|nr:hypothetical protein ARMGADRAFT_1029264 [Armillaria gallica]